MLRGECGELGGSRAEQGREVLTAGSRPSAPSAPAQTGGSSGGAGLHSGTGSGGRLPWPPAVAHAPAHGAAMYPADPEMPLRPHLQGTVDRAAIVSYSVVGEGIPKGREKLFSFWA